MHPRSRDGGSGGFCVQKAVAIAFAVAPSMEAGEAVLISGVTLQTMVMVVFLRGSVALSSSVVWGRFLVSRSLNHQSNECF